MERKAEIRRKTNETDIFLELNLDGSGLCAVDCPVGFLRHMLAAFCRHGLFDLRGTIAGDLDVDQHHLVEDTGITLGEAFAAALGEKRGIRRAGFFLCPMDEALAMVSIDISGRPYLVYDAQINREKVGDMAVEMAKEFFYAFSVQAGMTMHVRLLYGSNAHHCLEAIFKAFGHALKQAVKENEEGVLSTKGVL